MSLPAELRERLTLPAICAPMFSVTGPALVREACKAGIIGALPRNNADSFETFTGWLTTINRDLVQTAEQQPWRRIAPMAVNLRISMSADDFNRHLRLCADHGVQVANLPYGERMGDEDELAELYPQLGNVLKQRFGGWDTYLFTADLRITKLMRLTPSKRIPLFNGAIECRLFEYKIVAGSNRPK